ncbi:MAG: radical SAM protein [Halobacteriales archaeon]
MRPSSDGSGGKRSESGGPPAGTDHARRPVVVVWELTQACDLACKHCRAEAIPRRHPDELSTAEGRALLEGVRGFGAGQLVVLSGGDPIYRDDAIDLVEHGTDLGLRMTMTPSGTTSLDDGIIAELRDAGLRRLALSLDGGNAEAHDDFRGEAGSFDRTLAAARGADDLGLPLQVNTTVCAETVDDLPAIRDLVADLGAALWSVFFLVPVGRGATLESIQPARAEAVMRWLDEVREAASFGVKTTEAPHFRRVAMQRREIDPGATADEAPRRNGVTAGCGFMFVSHTGEVYPSGFLPVTTGSVLQSDPVRIYRESTLFRSLRDCDALRGKCGVCAYRHVCGGSRSRAYAATGDPLASDPLCPYRPAGYDGPMPVTSGR